MLLSLSPSSSSLIVNSTSSLLQEYLTSVSVEDWSAWDENEAAQLITFLGLDHTGGQMKCGNILDSLESVSDYQELQFVTFQITPWQNKFCFSIVVHFHTSF